MKINGAKLDTLDEGYLHYFQPEPNRKILKMEKKHSGKILR